MTQREFRLRARIDKLADERDLLSALLARARDIRFRHCIYCGRWGYGRACSMHRDLIQVDPKFVGGEAT